VLGRPLPRDVRVGLAACHSSPLPYRACVIIHF
jgi:hypothetical protein